MIIRVDGSENRSCALFNCERNQGLSMEVAIMVLEYLKVILTWPVLSTLVSLVFILRFREDLKALILRIAKIKLPGGAEIDTPQSTRLAAEDNKPAPQAGAQVQQAVSDLPNNLTPQQRSDVEALLRSYIATSYLWEYRYLNYFLARSTQVLLDWLVGLQSPTTYALYDSFWLPLIPSANERHAMFTALEAHHLIYQDESGLITVNPKGREYQQWRGALPPLTSSS
jgi:hypothetical protein